MAITFGGLATGMDTNAIVDQLMAIERQPINRLNTDKAWFQSRQAAYGAFDGKLKNFLSAIENLGSSEDLRKMAVSASTDDFLSATADSDALPGASYQVEVVSLAQVQKNVSQGYTDKSAESFGLGELTLTVGDNEAVTITIDETNNSLEGVMQAINNADTGVNASIINDGTDSPYRLVLTGEDVASSFSLTSTLPTYNGDISAQLQSGGFADQNATVFGSGTLDLSTGHQITLSNETNSLTDIMTAINAESGTTGVTASIVADGDNFVLSLDGGATITTTALTGGNYDPLSLAETQAATQAHIRVDSIDIYSESNTLDEAIPGLTLDLTSAEEGTTTTVAVSLDGGAIKSQIESFVRVYNDVMSYISSQSTTGDTAGGILGGDPGMNAVKRRMQDMLTTTINNSGSLAALSQLGLETQRDGTLVLDDETLTDAIQNNLDSVEKLLVGEGDTEGVAVRFQNYLKGMTDSIDGLYAANKKTTESTVRRIDSRIEQIEMRLEKKEMTMRNKFAALEELISGMNSQSSFLTQQMDMLSSMMTRNN